MNERFSPPAFEADYFAGAYRGYRAHTPPRKVRSYVAFVQQHIAEGRLLEVGCAYGFYAEAFSSSFQVVATDVSQHAIEEAQRLHSPSRVRYLPAALDALGEEPHTFDAIVAFDVLEHIEPIEAYRDDLLSLLRPGGWLFFSVPVYDGPLGPVVYKLDRDPTHIHKWPRNRWHRWAKRGGLLEANRLGLFRYALPSTYVYFAHPRLARFSPAVLFAFRKDNAP